MKKLTVLAIGSIVVLVPLFLLVFYVAESKADQGANKFESRSSEWAKQYPLQYESFTQSRKSNQIEDLLEKYPALVIMWAGYGFAKDYNAPRGHAYILEDNLNTLRTGGPTDDKTGPMPTACWTCKSSDVPRYMGEHGELDFFTGKWARLGSEIINPRGCAGCHESGTMDVMPTRPHLARAMDIEGSLKYADATLDDKRSLVCAQCHSEYYFKKTEWTDASGNKKTAKVVTFPWDNGFAVEDVEKYYDDRNFKDWTHKLSQAPMLKSQHPDYEMYLTGAHGLNDVSCADCHMPELVAGGEEYSSHVVGNPLDNMENTCMNCHDGSEQELRDNVDRKRARTTELSIISMDIIATAHIEAAKAWELGATEEEMQDIMQNIRHAQWRWDYSASSHGAFFHAPEEALRLLALGISTGQEARLKLRAVLAKYDAADYVAPDFSTKEKAQKIIGLPYEKLVAEKMLFQQNLRKEWVEEAKRKGLYDPKAWDGIEFKTSYK